MLQRLALLLLCLPQLTTLVGPLRWAPAKLLNRRLLQLVLQVLIVVILRRVLVLSWWRLPAVTKDARLVGSL